MQEYSLENMYLHWVGNKHLVVVVDDEPKEWDISLTMWEAHFTGKAAKILEEKLNTNSPTSIEFICWGSSLRYVEITKYEKHISTWDIYIKTY